jgi:N-acetyltransferase
MVARGVADDVLLLGRDTLLHRGLASAAAAAAAAAATRSAAERRLRSSAVDSKGGELLENVARATLGTRDRLLVTADELVEMILALHAGVLVDGHGPSVLSAGMERWTTPMLAGTIVRLEPLAPGHADDLYEASRDPRVWRWLPILQPQDRAEWDRWMTDAVERTAIGDELAFATVSQSTGAAIGSTRYLALRPEHRSLEIGWTWLTPDAWGTGANAEAKLLQLEHAFDVLGCRRVEFKTDALNERARPALAGLPSVFEGIHRKHMLVRNGVSRDSAWYSVMDDEWPAVRDSLRRRIG